MNHWQTDLLSCFAGAQTAQDIFHALESAAGELGFDHCAYGLRVPLPLSNPRVILHNNYPQSWQRQYLERGYLASDPTVRHAVRTCVPLTWTAESNDADQPFWSEARASGLRHGWCQSTTDGCGVAGMLTLARGTEPLTTSELDANELKMRWLINAVHMNMTRVHQAQINLDADVNLSRREVEVLRWMGDGKTSSEIADILSLSVDTVNYHITRAVTKLNCVNRTSAVVRAVVLGLLG